MAKVIIEHDDGVTEVYTGEVKDKREQMNTISFFDPFEGTYYQDRSGQLTLEVSFHNKNTSVSDKDKESA